MATYRNNSGTSNYNAAELKVEQRFSHGFTFLFAYTHSKLIDDASSVFSSTVLSSPNSSSLVAADTYRPYLERDCIQRRYAQRHFVQRNLRSARWAEAIALLRAGLLNSLVGGWSAEHLPVSSIGNAGNGHAGHQQQLVRGFRAAAAQPGRQAEPGPGDRTPPATSTPAPSKLHLNSPWATPRETPFVDLHIAISMWRSSRTARSPARRALNFGRVIQRDEYACLCPAERQLRFRCIWQHYRYNHRSTRGAAGHPHQPLILRE